MNSMRVMLMPQHQPEECRETVWHMQETALVPTQAKFATCAVLPGIPED